MKHAHRTIFRVVGGYNNHVLNEYAIIPYLVISETKSQYYLEEDGKIHKLPKRSNNNSELFEDIDAASQAIKQKLYASMDNINNSLKAIEAAYFVGLPYRAKLYIGRFRREEFSIECFRIIEKTAKAWKIDTEKTRRQTRRYRHTNLEYQVEVAKGRSYIYPKVSHPHDPSHPFEKWIGEDLDMMKSLMRLYAEDRLRHLYRCQQKQEDFVRQFKRQRQVE